MDHYKDLLAIRIVIDGNKKQDLVSLFDKTTTLEDVIRIMLVTGNDTLIINGGQGLHKELFHADMKARK